MEDRRDSVGGRRSQDLYAKWNVRVRDAIIFIVGIVGVGNELFIVPEPRPSILIFLGSLIGIPFVLSADESKSKKRDDDD